MTAVAEILRIPDIGHEGVLTVFDEYGRALSAESFFCILTPARIRQLCPLSHDAVGAEQAGFVGFPACAARRNHPVFSVVAEQSRSFVVSARENACVAACVACVGRIKFGNLNSQIVFG